MKTLRFICEEVGMTFWFNENEIKAKENTWIVNITKDDINKIIDKFQAFKFMIEYEKKNEKTTTEST